MFPDDCLVIDMSANGKGFLGRHRRPGYTEWQGERGTFVHQSRQPEADSASELRICSEEGIDGQTGQGVIHPIADHVVPVEHDFDGGVWRGAKLQSQRVSIEYVNPYRLVEATGHRLPAYGVAIMDHIIDFAAAVRGAADSEFDEEDALMSLIMEVAANYSARHEGCRVRLPLTRGIEEESDEISRASLKSQWGVDPLDVDGMLAINYPKP